MKLILPRMITLLGTGIGFGLGVGTYYMLTTSSQTTSSNYETIEQVNAMRQEIIGLKEAVQKTSHPVIDKSSFNQTLQKLNQSLTSLQSKGQEKITHLFSENQFEIGEKLSALSHQLNAIEKKQHPIIYKDKSILPFEIVSIDSIQQVSVLTVRYDYKVIPLEKGDNLAGWSILKLSYGTQKVELENDKKERVVVSLEVANEG